VKVKGAGVGIQEAGKSLLSKSCLLKKFSVQGSELKVFVDNLELKS